MELDVVVNSRIIFGGKEFNWTWWSTFGIDMVVNTRNGRGGTVDLDVVVNSRIGRDGKVSDWTW